MAAFGLKYYAELSSRYMKTLWRVEIAQRNYSGDPEEMTFSGSSPIKVTWENRGDDFYTPVKASEATINILCKENFHYLGLFTSDPRFYRMSSLGLWPYSCCDGQVIGVRQLNPWITVVSATEPLAGPGGRKKPPFSDDVMRLAEKRCNSLIKFSKRVEVTPSY